MSFIVSASTSARDVSYRHHSMLSALEQGLALLSCGMENVWITDICGRKRTPAEFGRAVFERRGNGRDTAISGSARAAFA